MLIPFCRLSVGVNDPQAFWARLTREARSRDIRVVGDPHRFRLEPRFRQRVLYRPVIASELVSEKGLATIVAVATTGAFEGAIVPALMVGSCIEALRQRTWWPPLLMAAVYHAAGMLAGFSPGVSRARKAIETAVPGGPSESQRAVEQ